MSKKLPKIISQEEFEKIFKAAPDKATKLGLLLGFEAGMRISEIMGLKDRIEPLTKDRVEKASIFISQGKGKKDRVVPRPRRFKDVHLSLLPLNKNFSYRTMERRVTNLGMEVLGKKITFHTLRHGFCTHLVNSGRPLHEVQMLAGHSRLDTTGLYLHADPKRAIQAAQEAF